MKYLIRSGKTGLYFSGRNSWVSDMFFGNQYSSFNLFRFIIKAYLGVNNPDLYFTRVIFARTGKAKRG